MSRLMFAAAVAALFPAVGSAQPGIPAGTGSFGGGPVGRPVVRPGLGMSAAPGFGYNFPPGFGGPTFNNFNRPFVGGIGGIGGFGGFFPFATYPNWYGGGPFAGYYVSPLGGYYGDYFPGSVANIPAEPQRTVALSNEFPATLTLEFPAAAKVWLNGEEVSGEAAAERVLTSPVLRPGEKYTFKVRAEWQADGKTYGYDREVALGAGDRSKLLVVSGTPK